MKVCIAEKPSVAREIAEVLGATKRMKDLRAPLYAQGAARLRGKLEAVEPCFAADDSAPLRHQTD